MLLIALGIGKKINCYYLFIFRGSVLIYVDDSFPGIFMSYIYKSVLIYQNTTLCHKLHVCNFNKIQ